MRRIVIALAATVSGLVLLFSWPTSTNQPVGLGTGSGDDTGGTSDGADTGDDSGTDSGTDSGIDSGTTDSDGGTGDGTSGAGSDDTNASTDSGTSTTYTGAAQSTQFGDVQVEITVTDGQITDATAISYPDRDRHDQQINGYAIPILEEETVAAQSADIDLVSGATVTSRAYVGSLQDALDQAGL